MQFRVVFWIFATAYIVSTSMASVGVGSFFPDTDGNLTKITWAHAVNNRSYLNDTLNDDKIMMIEADISLGKLNGKGADIPIMAHPPENVSDISLEQFLSTIKEFNTNATHKKGVKLDFKSTEVFEKSIDIVKEYEKETYPIWINADILPGPVNATTTPVDAASFLQGAALFPNATLSVGWTTNGDVNGTGAYTKDQIDAMLNVTHNVSQPITFPVRACFAAEDIGHMKTLLSSVAGSTLTIWSSEGDNVSVKHLRDLIGSVGISKTYIDVPSDLMDQLHLDDLPDGSGALNVAGSCVLMIFCVLVLFW